jgi:opacity protein-like surface antigen
MKRAALLAGLVLLAGSYAFAAEAPDRVGHWDLGVLGAGTSNDGNVDDSGWAQANLSYGVTPWIALGVEGGWQETDTNNMTEELGIVGVMGDIIVRHPYLHDQLVPYGVLGLGVIGAYLSNEPPTNSSQQGDDVDDTAFGWKLGGGLDWFLNDNWVVNFEVAYWDGDVDLPGTSVADDDISFWTFGGGLKFVF